LSHQPRNLADVSIPQPTGTEKFLEYLGTAVERFGIKVHTYCLMTNQYHFLIETPEANLSRAVQWLNVKLCSLFQPQTSEMRAPVSGGFKKNTARDVAIYLCRELTAATGTQLGKYFADISGAGITVRYNHVVKTISRNRRLKGRINRIKKRILNN